MQSVSTNAYGYGKKCVMDAAVAVRPMGTCARRSADVLHGMADTAIREEIPTLAPPVHRYELVSFQCTDTQACITTQLASEAERISSYAGAFRAHTGRTTTSCISPLPVKVHQSMRAPAWQVRRTNDSLPQVEFGNWHAAWAGNSAIPLTHQNTVLIRCFDGML
jgi:hypothetical protein